MEEVRVIIPNYKGIKYIGDCLTSLLEDIAHYDFLVGITVVDNGCEDPAERALLESFEGRGVKVIYLSENTGFCHAVNVGIEDAEAPYVILLNNDTKVCPGFVKALYKAISSDDGIFSVSSKMLMWDDDQYLDDAGDLYSALGWSRARGHGRYASDYHRACEIFSACGGAAIYRKSIFGEIGLFDEDHFAYLEDLDVGWRAQIAGYRNRYEPTACVVHYGSASTGSRYNERKTTLSSANNIYVISKNMPLLQIILNFPWLLFGFLVKLLFFTAKGMGKLYAEGIREGFRKSRSFIGRAKRVRFTGKHFGNYVRIQGQLWINIVRGLF